MRKIMSLLLLASLTLWAGDARAQDWPAHPVKIIVPFAPGSTPDVVARVFAEFFQQEFKGQPFIIENKPGANGNIGTDAVAKASPDGYTIGVSIAGPLAVNTLLFSNLRYDPKKDIAPISQLVSQPSILAVSSKLAAKTVSELIDQIRAQPDKFTYGSIGIGSISHLGMEALTAKAGAKLVHLPLPGSPAAAMALIRGDVQMALLPATSVANQAQTGDIRLLAVSSGRRVPYLKDLPTLKESGLDVEADAWVGLIAPAGTPAAIIEALHRSVVKAVQSPAIRQKFEPLLMQPVGGTPQELADLMASDLARWKPIIEGAKIKAE